MSYRLSRDGTRVAVHRMPSPLPLDNARSEVWIMDASGERPIRLTDNGVEEGEAEISPDGSQVLFVAEANQRFEPYHNATLFLVPAAGGMPRPVIPDFPHYVDRATWAPDGRSILIVAQMGVHSEMFQIDLATRTARQLTSGRHSIPAAPAPVWNLAPGPGRLVFLFDEPSRFGDVWTLALTPGAQPARVTGVYDGVERTFRLPRQERIEWKSSDGAAIEGLLFYPLDYTAGRRYPLVVQIHGGPGDADRFGFWGWSDYIQVLTGADSPSCGRTTGAASATATPSIATWWADSSTTRISMCWPAPTHWSSTALPTPTSSRSWGPVPARTSSTS